MALAPPELKLYLVKIYMKNINKVKYMINTAIKKDNTDISNLVAYKFNQNTNTFICKTTEYIQVKEIVKICSWLDEKDIKYEILSNGDIKALN
jgi:hypothetical protein